MSKKDKPLSTQERKLGEFEEINRIFIRNYDKVTNLLEHNFLDEAVILMVTIQEVFWKDLFVSNKEMWFRHLANPGIMGACTIEEEINYRTHIHSYLKSIGAYDEFLRTYYIYQETYNPAIISIYHTLFNGNDKINFQNLKDKNGVKKAYLVFFGINLVELFDENTKESAIKWKQFTDLFKERHEIIHAGKSTSFTKDGLRESLESVKYMKLKLLNEIYGCYGIQFSME